MVILRLPDRCRYAAYKITMAKSPPQYTKYLTPINTPVARPLDNPKKIPWKFAVDQNIQPGSLNYASLDQNSKIYRAVVGLSRTKGAYQSIQEAVNNVVNQGGGAIFIKNGKYVLSANLQLAQNIELVGESRDGVIIDFGATDSCVLASGGSSEYKTGTVATTNGSAHITGSGTAWLANVNTTQKILLDGTLYGISAVGSDTDITLDEVYYGASFSGLSYVIGSFISNVNLTNLTIQNASGATQSGIINFSYVINSYLDNLNVNTITSGTGACVYLKRCYNVKLHRVEAYLGYNYGIDIDSGQSCVVDTCYVHNCATHGSGGAGIGLNNTLGLGTKNIIKDSFIANNGTAGVLSGSGKNIIKGNIIFRSFTDGVILASGENLVEGNIIEQSHGYGVNNNTSNASNNTIASNYVSFNTSGGLLFNNASQAENVVVANNFRDSSGTAFSILFVSGVTGINYIQSNLNTAYLADRKYVLASNVSSGTINNGNLVIVSAASGNSPNVTTSTSTGDNKIMGMAAESFGSGAAGDIQVGGYTESLLVSGTVSVGNFITNSTTAGVGTPAVAGNTVIAIAYGTYSGTVSGTIAAYIISPRLI